jgi:hypothetical protein
MMWMCWLKGISWAIRLRNSSHWRWVCVWAVLSDDFALQIIRRGKEGNRTVAIIVVGLGADMPFAQRQIRLVALKSLIRLFSSQQSTTARSGGLR